MPTEPIPEPPNGKHQAARRRRLAYALAAAILLIAGIVGGIVATQPAPKRRHVAVAVAPPKPAPKPVTLSTAEFLARWAVITNGPSTITRGTTETVNGITTPRSVVVNVAPGPVWTWHMALSAGGAVTGTASKAGVTVTTTYTHWGPGTPAFITAQGPQPPTVDHPSLAWFGDLAPGNLLVASVRELRGAGPQRVLADPVVTAATATSWTVRLDVVWPYCLENYPSTAPACAGTTTGPPPAPPSSSSHAPTVTYGGGGDRFPGPTVTATVTPTAAGGLLISLQPSGFTLLANPT